MNEAFDPSGAPIVGRYALHGEIASGGMATVHLGRLLGPVGFSRAVAIKRLHEQYAKDPQFVAMFLDEARLAARVRHQNVVSVLDVVTTNGQLYLVMDYVHGESVSRLMATIAGRGDKVPAEIAVGIAIHMLEGLHAAHEAKSERGEPLDIVHRDVSPQNVLVGTDGVARVFDFGVAKAAGRMMTTQDGSLKGKMAYMSPEQLNNEPVDRRTDVWATSVVLWEMLAGRRLFFADSAAGLVSTITKAEVPNPSSIAGVPKELDAVLRRGLARDKKDRYASAREMSVALEKAVRPATPRAIAEWLELTAGDTLQERAKRVEEMESEAGVHRPSHGTVSSKLAALGLETRPTSALAEEPTAAPPGRVGQHAPPSSPASSPDVSPAAQFNAASVVGVGSTHHPPPRRKSSMRWVWGAFALGLLTAFVFGVVIFRGAGAPKAAATPSATSPKSAEPPASVAVSPPASTSAAPPSLAPTPATPSVSVASTLAAPPSSARPQLAVRPSTPKGSGKVQPPSQPKPDCDPPYTIGPAPDFIKKPKLECLPQ